MRLLWPLALALWCACATPQAALAADISWRGANTKALDDYARLHWLEWNGSAWVWKAGFDASILTPFTIAASASVDVSAYDPGTGSYPLWAGGVVPGAGDIARLVWHNNTTEFATVGGIRVVEGNVTLDGAFAPDHIVLGPSSWQRVTKDLVIAKHLEIQTINISRGYTTGTHPDVIVNDGFSLTMTGVDPFTFGGSQGSWGAINLNGANAALRFNAPAQTLTPPPTNYVHANGTVYGGFPLRGSGPVEFINVGATISLAHPGTRTYWTTILRTIAMPAMSLATQSLRVRSDQTWSSPTRTGLISKDSSSGQPLFVSIDGGILNQFNVPFSVRTADSIHTFTIPAGTFQSFHTHRSSDTQRASTMQLLGDVTLTGGTVIPGSSVGGYDAYEGTYSILLEGMRRMSQYLHVNGFSLTTARSIHIYHHVEDRTAADERTRILAAGSTLDIGGDLVIESVMHPAGTVNVGVLDETRGMGVFGDATTVLTLRGNFLSNVRSPTGSGLYLSTVNLVGGLITNTFEVGADPADLITTNTYAIGTLNIGTPTTTGNIRLVNASINDGDPSNIAKTGENEILLAGTLNIDASSILDLNGLGAKVVTGLTIDATGSLDLNTGPALADGDRVVGFRGVGDQTAAWTACADRVLDSTNPGVTFAPVLDGGDTYWQASLPDVITWTGATSNDWSLASNWNPATVPGPDNLVRIGPDAPTRTTVTLTAPVSVARIEFADADMTIDGAQTLTLTDGLSIGSGNAYVISCPVALGQPQTWDTGSGSLLSSGIISGNYTLTKAGAGTWTASAANTYSGHLIISAGTMIADHTTATGASTSVVSVQSGASLELTTVTVSDQSLYLDGAGVGGTGALRTAGSGTWAGPVILGSATTLGGTGSGTISGPISGNFNLSKTQSGSWILSGDSAGWSSNLDFVDGSSGRIIAAHNNALGSTGSVTVSAGNSLELAAASIPVGKTLSLAGDGGGATVGALIATGADNVWAGPVTLTAATTIGGSGNGTISGVCAGNQVLTKVGAALWILTRANVFSGVVVNDGTLRVTHLDALGNVDATPVSVSAATVEIAGVNMTRPAFTLANGATVRGIGTAGFTRAFTVVTGGTATLGYSSSSDVFTVAGALLAAGQGSLIIAGAADTIGGKVVLSGNSQTWIDGNLDVQEHATLELVASTTPYYPMGANGGTGSVTIAEGATLRVRCAHTAGVNLHRDFEIGGDGVDGLGALIGINNGAGRYIAMNGNMTLSADTSLGGVDNTSALRGTISGPFHLTQRGPGSWELSGNNSGWLKNIIVVAGTLVANMTPSSSTSVLGDAIGTTTVQNGATLQFVGAFNSPEPVTVTGTGVGGLGALQGPSGSDSTLPICSGAITLGGPTSMATRSSNASARLRLSGTISGSHAITIGAGDVQFEADNGVSFTGGIFITGGRLITVHANALGDAVGSTTIANGGRLWVSGSSVGTDIYEPLIMQGAGGGAGQAALNIDRVSTIWYGDILLSGHATLGLTQNDIRIHGVISDGGNGYALTKIGTNAGTSCSLRSANTYGGGTFINQGILRTTHEQGMGSGTVTVANGATLQLDFAAATATWSNNVIINGAGVSSGGAFTLNSPSCIVTMPAGTSITLASASTITCVTSNHLQLEGTLLGSTLLTLNSSNSNNCFLILSGNNSAFTGSMLINGMRVRALHDNALGDATGMVTVSGTNFGGLWIQDVNLPANKTLRLNGAGGDGGGSLRVSGSAAWNGPVILQSATSIGSTIVADATFVGTINGPISGNFTLTKAHACTWILTGDGDGWTGNIAYANATSGRLVARHDHALGTGGTVTVTSSNILELDGAAIPSGKSLVIAGDGGSATTGALIATGADNGWAGPVTLTAATTIGGVGAGVLGGTLSGGFSLTKCGAGTWTLAGNNSGYAAAIAFVDGSSGRLIAAHDNALGSAAGITVRAGCTLELANASVASKTLSLGGSGNDGNGCLVATGSAAWSGALTLTAASIFSGSGNGVLSGAIGGAHPLTKLGSGSWTLAGAGSYTTTTIDAGILAILSPGSAGSGAVTVNAAGTLAGTGTISGDISLVGGGTVAPGTVAGSIGTLSVGGSLSGTGTLVLAMNGASADRLAIDAVVAPVTLTAIALQLSGLPTATATLLSFPNGTHATNFASFAGVHPSCSGPNYEDHAVTIIPATLDLRWTGNSTGTGTAIERIWPLGALTPGYVATSESGRFAQVFELENKSTYEVLVTVTASNALRTVGGNTDWTLGLTSDVDQFIFELKPAGDAWANLTAARVLVSGLAIDAAKAFDLRFTAPTATTNPNQKSITITATATVAP